MGDYPGLELILRDLVLEPSPATKAPPAIFHDSVVAVQGDNSEALRMNLQ